MALRACRECGTEVSTEAKTCPKCGAPSRRSVGVGGVVLRIALTAGLAWFIWTVFVPPGMKAVARKLAPDALVPQPVVRKKETIKIHEDQYMHYTFEASGTVSIDVRLVGGPPIDVYFVDAARVDDYIKKKKFYYYPTLSQEGARNFKATANVPKGRYALVLDNTDYGGTAPPMNMVDDVATVEVEIRSD